MLDTASQLLPRIVVAGLSGDAGKSLVAVGLARALARQGRKVAPFKKGPDYIDAAWLGAAARAPGRNLDTFLMSRAAIEGSLLRAARGADLAVIEGNRGLFDGFDAEGSHSTAELAKLVGAPVVLVVSAVKVTRTVAAQVLGCRTLDPDLTLAGVVLNRVATSRQERLIRAAVEAITGVPVVGAIPRREEPFLPSRHLGLVCPAEHPSHEDAIERLATFVEEHVDIERIRSLAGQAGPLAPAGDWTPAQPADKARVRIGILRDAAFSFYYPENLEALKAAGAEIVPISPLTDETLPEIDGLVAGGGFPEEHAEQLSANRSFRARLAAAISGGLPVWAECGGLMYLSEVLMSNGVEHPMVGALPLVVRMERRPQGHGYVAARVDADNPFLSRGTTLAGHEFHYARVVRSGSLETVLAVDRGTGMGGGREGLRVHNVVATWMHVHALGAPEWAPGVVRAARGERSSARKRPLVMAEGVV